MSSWGYDVIRIVDLVCSVEEFVFPRFDIGEAKRQSRRLMRRDDRPLGFSRIKLYVVLLLVERDFQVRKEVAIVRY